MNLQCSHCGKSQAAKETRGGNLRLPPGWKRTKDQVLCKECKAKLYRLRAVTLPVTGVLEGGTWQEFCAACHRGWRRSTDLANFAVKCMVRNDRVRQPGDTEWRTAECRQMPEIDLYRYLKQGTTEPYAGIADWTGAKTSANSILRTVKERYIERRYEVVWLSQATAATHKYPQPYPVYNRDWSADYRQITDPDGETRNVPVVTIRLDGQRWVLRLRSGYLVRRHLAGFAHLVNGAAIQGELALYGVPTSRGCHRRVSTSRPAGGGNRTQTRILCKMAAYLPRPEQSTERDGILVVRTGSRALLVAQFPDDHTPWVLKNNQVRQWIFRHGRFLQDIGDDMKAERRPQKKRVRIQQKIDARCQKHRNQIGTFVKTTAAHLIAYANRRKAARIEYRDYDRRYIPNQADGRANFPWAALRSAIQSRAEEAGLEFVHIEQAPELVLTTELASGEVVDETPVTARGM